MSDLPDSFPQIETHLAEGSTGVCVACFSGDGRRLLTAQDSIDVAKIWDLPNQSQLGEIHCSSESDGKNGFKTYIEDAVLNQDGTLAFLGHNDGTAGLYRASVDQGGFKGTGSRFAPLLNDNDSASAPATGL